MNNTEIFVRYLSEVRSVFDEEEYKSFVKEANRAYDKDTKSTAQWMLGNLRLLAKHNPHPHIIDDNDDDNYSNCKHTHKVEYGEFHICDDCNYHFCYGDQKYSHPDQYKNCEHPVIDDVLGELTCHRCGLRFGTVFSKCEHRRKKRFFDCSDFYCCADCEYHFVDGDPKLRHPSQYENCKHSDQRMIDNQLTCLRCGLKSTGPPPIPFVYKPYDDVCKHTHLEEKNGNTFCTNCGLFEEYESINELCTDHEYHARIQKDKNNLNEHSKVKDLREAATKIGVKRVTVMSKKQLCKVLGIKISNEGKYILKNLKTGEEHRFKNKKLINLNLGN